MAKNRASFGDAASKGLRESFGEKTQTSFEFHQEEPQQKADSMPKAERKVKKEGSYYHYHPRTGNRGGSLGRPRAIIKRTQISIGCTEDEKELYRKAAAADGRKLPDFVNKAIMEYITNHGLEHLL